MAQTLWIDQQRQIRPAQWTLAQTVLRGRIPIRSRIPIHELPTVPVRLHMNTLIEALESRIAPAAIFTYTESDGDLVTVSSTAKVSAEFLASKITVTAGTLTKLSLNDSIFQGTSLTVGVTKRGTNGDGLVHVNEIDATVDLASVRVGGDISNFAAGDLNLATRALGKYTGVSIGKDAIAAGQSSSFSTNGRLTELVLTGELQGTATGDNLGKATIGSITDASGAIGSLSYDRIGSVLVKGDVKGRIVGNAIGTVAIGGDLSGNVAMGSGEINSEGSIGRVTIKGSIIGNFESAGQIVAEEAIGRVVINGSILGNANSSGTISAPNIFQVTVGGDVTGKGTVSGVIHALQSLGSVKIAGDLSGTGNYSGTIGADRSLGSVEIGGDLLGGLGSESGYIAGIEGGTIGRVLIHGSVKGGAGPESGSIHSSNGSTTSIKILGNLEGGDGQYSGTISGENVYSIVVRGGVLGGSQESSGAILVENGGAITIYGALKGGAGERSGTVRAAGELISTSIRGGILGGTGLESGRVDAEVLDFLTVRGGIEGGTNEAAGSVEADSAAVIKVIGNVKGGTGDRTGSVSATNGIAIISISGDVTGGVGPQSGSIFTTNGSIGQVTVSGNLSGSSDSGIYAGRALGTVTIGKSITGTSPGSQVQIGAGAMQPSDALLPAIGIVSVKGSVENAIIRAGAEFDGNFANADTTIGSVTVKGNWTASSIVASVMPGSDTFYGTSDDILSIGTNAPSVISRIASIVIGGTATGTAAAGDGFTFAAQQIGALKIKGVVLPLTPGSGNDLFPGIVVGSTNDLRAVEIATT